jgi:hypothetical protein
MDRIKQYMIHTTIYFFSKKCFRNTGILHITDKNSKTCILRERMSYKEGLVSIDINI